VSGWRVSGITRLQSDIPLGTIAGACNAPLMGNCFTNYNSTFSGNVRINGD